MVLASGVKVKPSSSVVVNASPLARTVPSALFKVPEVGIAVMEMVNESPSESVGADKFREPASTSSVREIATSDPAIGALFEGGTGVGVELPPPPPPQAATIKAIRLADASFGSLRNL